MNLFEVHLYTYQNDQRNIPKVNVHTTYLTELLVTNSQEIWLKYNIKLSLQSCQFYFTNPLVPMSVYFLFFLQSSCFPDIILF